MKMEYTAGMPDLGFVRLLAQTEKEMRGGVLNFTDDGKCSNCGQCCSDFLPISDEEIKRIKRYVQRKGIKEHRLNYPTAAPAEDYTCPFRNNVKRVCEIYEVRPAICRDFKCDKPEKEIWANKRMYHGMYRVVRMRNEFFGKKGR